MTRIEQGGQPVPPEHPLDPAKLTVHRDFRPHVRGAILDFGCRDGERALSLLDRVDTVFGVDTDPRLIEQAKKARHAFPLQGDRARFQVIPGQELPFDDHSFDGALLVGTIGGIVGRDTRGERVDVLREATRVLKPGAVLYVAEYAARAGDNPSHRHTYTQPELVNDLHRAGVGNMETRALGRQFAVWGRKR